MMKYWKVSWKIFKSTALFVLIVGECRIKSRNLLFLCRLKICCIFPYRAKSVRRKLVNLWCHHTLVDQKNSANLILRKHICIQICIPVALVSVSMELCRRQLGLGIRSLGWDRTYKPGSWHTVDPKSIWKYPTLDIKKSWLWIFLTAVLILFSLGKISILTLTVFLYPRLRFCKQHLPPTSMFISFLKLRVERTCGPFLIVFWAVKVCAYLYISDVARSILTNSASSFSMTFLPSSLHSIWSNWIPYL